VAPLAHFPPGFSTAIAIPTIAGMAPIQAARLVNALAAAGTVIAMSYVVASSVGLLAAAACAVAFMVARPLVLVHLALLSEPLFLCCFALVLLAMVRDWPPLAAGSIAAAAALVRYAGIAATGATVLWYALRPGTVRDRARRAAMAALPSVVFLGLWVIRTRGGRGGIRELGIYRGIGRTLVQGAQTLVAWLVPTNDPPTRAQWWMALGIVVLIALVITGGVSAARRRGRATRVERLSPIRVLAACAVFAACYAVVLVMSRLFADANIPFDERLLSPIMMMVTMSTAVAAGAAWRGWSVPLRALVVAMLVVWVDTSARVSYIEAAWAVSYGSDLAGDNWRTSPLIAWTRAHAGSAPIMSNWPAAIYFHLHRPAWQLPRTANRDTLRALVDTLAARRAIAVVFDWPNPDAMPPTRMDSLGLRVLVRTPDGAVYGW